MPLKLNPYHIRFSIISLAYDIHSCITEFPEQYSNYKRSPNPPKEYYKHIMDLMEDDSLVLEKIDSIMSTKKLDLYVIEALDNQFIDTLHQKHLIGKLRYYLYVDNKKYYMKDISQYYRLRIIDYAYNLLPKSKRKTKEKLYNMIFKSEAKLKYLPTLADEDSNNVLHHIISDEKYDITYFIVHTLGYLLYWNKYTNNKGNTPLDIAVKTGNSNVFHQLLECPDGSYDDLIVGELQKCCYKAIKCYQFKIALIIVQASDSKLQSDSIGGFRAILFDGLNEVKSQLVSTFNNYITEILPLKEILGKDLYKIVISYLYNYDLQALQPKINTLQAPPNQDPLVIPKIQHSDFSELHKDTHLSYLNTLKKLHISISIQSCMIDIFAYNNDPSNKYHNAAKVFFSCSQMICPLVNIKLYAGIMLLKFSSSNFDLNDYSSLITLVSSYALPQAAPFILALNGLYNEYNEMNHAIDVCRKIYIGNSCQDKKEDSTCNICETVFLIEDYAKKHLAGITDSIKTTLHIE